MIPWDARFHRVLIRTFETPIDLAEAAATEAASHIRAAIAGKGKARVTAATGASQIEFLKHLLALPGIRWDLVELFHLDEYIGLPGDHPASFQRYIRERIVEPAGIGPEGVGPAGIEMVHYIDGMADPAQTCARAGQAISAAPVDVAFAGIGENGHLAFNDPPADFETEDPFLVVHLDERARRQQVSEGWFPTLDDAPRQAITMSIRQILKARAIVCVVTGIRKTEAVYSCFTGDIRPAAPASALRLHPHATVFLDRNAASLLPRS
jgi:glucosamine-6-phosphate deaminase